MLQMVTKKKWGNLPQNSKVDSVYRSMQRENSPIFRGKLRVEKGNYMKSKHSSENKVRKGKHVFPCRDKTVNDAAVHILTRPDPKRIHDAWEELKTL